MNVDLVRFNFYLLSYSLKFTYRFTEPYLVSFNFFNPWWQRRSKLPYSFLFVHDFFFVSIYCDNFLLCVFKHQTALTNYCPVLTFYLSHNETESSLLLVFKACSLRLIVCIIHTSFHIHSPFFIYWKHNITLIWQTCWGRTTDLFDMNLVKEYKLGGCQWRKLGFIVIGWYMPYFRLFPFVLSKQYGEGEISRFSSLFMHNIFSIMICTYSLSSERRLSMINHCFVWRCLASFHLPSFLVPCWIFCILVILGWSLKKARLTVDLHTASKPFWWR